MKKKIFRKSLWEKVKMLKMSNFTFLHNDFYAILSKKHVLATFQLSSAASLNSGWSENGVVGDGLNPHLVKHGSFI